MKKVLCLIVAILVIGCGQVFAATIVSPDGWDEWVSGIDGLVIGDLGTFDVDFIYGHFSEVYELTGYDYINNEADAWTAVGAINAALNDSGLISLLDENWGAGTNFYDLVFHHDSDWYYYYDSYAYAPAGPWTADPYVFSDPDVPSMLAILTPSSGQSSVPIPGAIWLLGSGLVGLVGCRRKLRS